jgi:bifunctional N-acetylglucosamine-1-phosphate-uridyltransferase/glucosamine-1-phosphate-acetyltransferase GlmU-like protein
MPEHHPPPAHVFQVVVLHDTAPPQGLGLCVMDESSQYCIRILESYEDQSSPSLHPLLNTGMYLTTWEFLFDKTPLLQKCPLSQEIRITDLIPMAHYGRGALVIEFSNQHRAAFLNINTYYDWMIAEHTYLNTSY